MDRTSKPPSVALTAPGICTNLPVSQTPAAGEVSDDNGSPVARVTIGHLATGKPVTLAITSLRYLDELEASLRVTRARLAFHLQDHTVHPFGESVTDGDFLDVARAAGVPAVLS
jgi:hypothetical protein